MGRSVLGRDVPHEIKITFVCINMLSFFTFLLPNSAKSFIEIKTHEIFICVPLNVTNIVFYNWADESQ